MPNYDQDFARFFLEEEPRSAFFSATQPFQTSNRMRRFLQEQFQPVWNEFLGAMGRQARLGQVPDLRFADFTQGTNFPQQFQQQPRWQRGESAQFFNPRMRFLF